MKKISLITMMLISSLSLLAQNQNVSEVRSSGKIYVVVGIIAIIFALIVIYLIRLDSKISKLEKDLK